MSRHPEDIARRHTCPICEHAHYAKPTAIQCDACGEVHDIRQEGILFAFEFQPNIPGYKDDYDEIHQHACVRADCFRKVLVENDDDLVNVEITLPSRGDAREAAIKILTAAAK